MKIILDKKEEKQMKAKEAIKYLKNARVYMARSTGMSANCPLYKAFMLAILALERREPKKIVTRENLHGKYDACPYCGCATDSYYDIKCCSNCGQALDWSDK